MNKNKEKEYNIDDNSKIAISDYNIKKIWIKYDLNIYLYL